MDCLKSVQNFSPRPQPTSYNHSRLAKADLKLGFLKEPRARTTRRSQPVGQLTLRPMLRLLGLASALRAAVGVAVRSELEVGTPAGSAIRPGEVVPEFTSPLSPPHAPPPAPPPLTCMSLDVSVDGGWCTLTCASATCPPICYCGSPTDVAEAVSRRDTENAEMDEAAYVPPPEPVQALPVPEPVFSDDACDFDRQGCLNSTLAVDAPVTPKCAGCEDYPIAPSASTVTLVCRSCGDQINICHINGLSDGNFTAQTVDECIDQVAKMAQECKTCSTPHNKEAYRWRLGMPETDASGKDMTAYPDYANVAEQAASEATEVFENAEAEADNNRRKVGAESKRAQEAGSVAREEAEADAAVLRDEAEEDAKAQVAVAAQVADAAEEEAKAQAAVAASDHDEAYAEAEAAFKAAKAAARASREAAEEAHKEAKRAHKAAHAAAASSPSAKDKAVPKGEEAAAPGDWKSEQEARQRADDAESLADEFQPAPARATGCCSSTSGPSECWGCGETGNGLCHASSESCRTKCEGAWLASEGRPLCALVTRVRVASEDDPWHASES